MKCKGTLVNNPRKTRTWCSLCGRIDYDGNENDRCRFPSLVTCGTCGTEVKSLINHNCADFIDGDF